VILWIRIRIWIELQCWIHMRIWIEVNPDLQPCLAEHKPMPPRVPMQNYAVPGIQTIHRYRYHIYRK
jgi:hypothetical protein